MFTNSLLSSSAVSHGSVVISIIADLKPSTTVHCFLLERYDLNDLCMYVGTIINVRKLPCFFFDGANMYTRTRMQILY